MKKSLRRNKKIKRRPITAPAIAVRLLIKNLAIKQLRGKLLNCRRSWETFGTAIFNFTSLRPNKKNLRSWLLDSCFYELKFLKFFEKAFFFAGGVELFEFAASVVSWPIFPNVENASSFRGDSILKKKFCLFLDQYSDPLFFFPKHVISKYLATEKTDVSQTVWFEVFAKKVTSKRFHMGDSDILFLTHYPETWSQKKIGSPSSENEEIWNELWWRRNKAIMSQIMILLHFV